MSLESEIAEVVRSVVREELSAVTSASDLELLTASGVADLLKFDDPRAVYRLAREGRLKPLSLGERTLRFRVCDVRRFLSECENGSDISDQTLANGNGTK